MTLPSWPYTVNYLAEVGSYSLIPHSPLQRTEFDYGPARVRRRFVTSNPVVTFTISMTSGEFEIFKGFYHHDIIDGAGWFTMPVYFGSEETLVKCRFMEAYTVSEAVFGRIKVGIKIETKELPIIEPYVSYLVQEYGTEGVAFMQDHLQYVVNVQYPDVTRNL